MKNLTDWFDKVYVINCAHRPDRLADVTVELERSNMADMQKVTIYPAIVGDWTGIPSDWKAGKGAWGCLRSHARVLEDVMHIRDDRDFMSCESVLILEDDVFFLDGALQDLNAFMEEVPKDWGQIYLGGQHRKKAEALSSNVSVGKSINRTHAYAVNQACLERLYAHISYATDYRNTTKHIDHQLEVAHRRGDWKVYCPPKWICGQVAGNSNINGRNNPEQMWQP